MKRNAGAIERRSWRNWWLLATCGLTATVGLAIAMYPLISKGLKLTWPWQGTDDVLLWGVCTFLAVVVVYLTAQQQRLFAARRRIDALEQTRVADLHRQHRRLMALFNVSTLIKADVDLQDIFDGVTSTCVQAFRADWASLMIHEAETDELVVRSACGDSPLVDMKGRSRAIGQGLSGWAAARRQALILGPTIGESTFGGVSVSGERIRSSMVVPIVLADKLLGVLNVATRRSDHEFDENDLETLKVFAENAGAAIQHAEEISWIIEFAKNLDPQRPRVHEDEIWQS